jgi:hypothetical protein
MAEDARFEDGVERPLNLGAEDSDDLQVISGLCQDSVLPVSEMRYAKRRFALLLNRFRWENETGGNRTPERVQSILVFEDVLSVATQGIDRSDKDTILSLLSIAFEPGEDGTGHITLTLAGDGAIRLSVEALGVTLRDVTRPYLAPSKSVPRHED